MNSNVITVFEYGFLSSVVSDNRCAKVSPDAFKYLESLCLNQASEMKNFLRLRSYSGERALQLKHYVGVIQIPNGEQIEVLPKVGKVSNEATADILTIDNSRKSLLNMLKTMNGFRHIESADAQVNQHKMPLFEVFIRQFLKSVNQLVKRGLRSDYVSKQDNLLFLKGKLLTSQQLKYNLVNKHKFYVEYDEYILDRPANRLIHTALNKIANYSKNNAHQRLCRELSFAFNDIPVSHNIKQDFAQVKLNRGMSYYQTPLAWAKLILEGMTPLAMKGKANAISLLFPMHDIFESYVGSVLRRQLQDNYSLEEQARSEYLVQHEDNEWFNLKPDFLIKEDDTTRLVLDTKWKLLDSRDNNGSDKYGLSQNDFYQMFAYAHKYLTGNNRQLILIYPKTDKFSETIGHSFDFSDDIKLWVVPFDVSSDVDDSERIKPIAKIVHSTVNPKRE
jgi:5-methylcytosine-specific restriction enzyme subunit McrC